MILFFIKLILEIFTVTCFILFDNLFYKALELISRHASIDYAQEGVHDVNITVIYVN